MVVSLPDWPSTGENDVAAHQPHAPAVTAQTVTVTLANQRTEIDILRRRMGASVLLVKALGGGWDVAERPKAEE